MAVYIEIKKLDEKEGSAVYIFSMSDGRSGKFGIDKADSSIRLTEPIPNDDGSLYARAAYKIRKSWEKDRENLPDLTCWAS